VIKSLILRLVSENYNFSLKHKISGIKYDVIPEKNIVMCR